MTVSPAPQPTNHNHRKRKILIAGAIFIALGILWFLYWFIFLFNRVSTDDAYVGGNRVILNAQVEGGCIAYYADNNQYVEKGDLLVEIDPTLYTISFRQSLADLENVSREVKQLEEEVNALEFQIMAQQRVVETARYDFENRQAVVDVLAVAREDVEHNLTNFSAEQDKLEAMEAQLIGKLALLGSGPLEEHPWILSQAERVRDAYTNLSRCRVYAPVSGLVALRYVQVGQYIFNRTEMLSVVPYEQMWVDANFREPQLRNIRINQPTTVTFDEFGSSVVFKGYVQGIQMGTGAAFSLLPAQNATGNWIKIVQRVPVRIQLDPEDIRKHPLRIGLSSYVTVNTENREGDVLQRKGGFSWEQSTDVLDIDFTPVEAVMAEIIQENLHVW